MIARAISSTASVRAKASVAEEIFRRRLAFELMIIAPSPNAAAGRMFHQTETPGGVPALRESHLTKRRGHAHCNRTYERDSRFEGHRHQRLQWRRGEDWQGRGRGS